MRRVVQSSLVLGGALLALCSTLVFAQPESLLPPSFDNPAPTPTPRAAPPPATGGANSSSASIPVVQPLPARRAGAGAAAGIPQAPAVKLPTNLPSLAELEKMSPDEIDKLFGLKPKFDVPPGAHHALTQVGVIDRDEGGFAADSLASQPAALIRAVLDGTRKPLVSRWGHILLRRALASRLDPPSDMDPVEFIALRAALLDRIGEAQVARALVQDVESASYNPALANAAFDAYLATGDLLGICPVAQLNPDLIDTPNWQMARSICRAFAGGSEDAGRELDRDLYYGVAPRIDVLLAQRFAGAAGETRRDITIEWQGINQLNPWRFSLARTLGVDVPDALRKGAGPEYDFADIAIPAVPLAARVAAADRAGARGVLSSAAMVDLYSQLWADPSIDDSVKSRADTLREAYAARDAGARLDALKSLWGNNNDDYGAKVLTAYAAARLPVLQPLANDAPRIVASMLSAGLDRNAVQWNRVVDQGSEAWGMLAIAQPNRANVASGGIGKFIDQDKSPVQRKARFLVAGLAGLGRIDANAAAGYARDLHFDLARQSAWSTKIDRAAQLGNPTLVALLAALGMQGEGWDKMTARHLFHIVQALDRVGLDGEARMIAAEAVARA